MVLFPDPRMLLWSLDDDSVSILPSSNVSQSTTWRDRILPIVSKLYKGRSCFHGGRDQARHYRSLQRVLMLWGKANLHQEELSGSTLRSQGCQERTRPMLPGVRQRGAGFQEHRQAEHVSLPRTGLSARQRFQTGPMHNVYLLSVLDSGMLQTVMPWATVSIG